MLKLCSQGLLQLKLQQESVHRKEESPEKCKKKYRGTNRTVSENESGWIKEVNLVKWNDREPVYDIRVWQEGHEKLGKGITLTEAEIKNLKELLNKMDI